MNDETNEMAEQVAIVLGGVIAGFLEQTEFPIEAVLAGCHAQIITEMVTRFGGPMTATCCEQAADRVRNLPSLATSSLAFTPPAGSA